MSTELDALYTTALKLFGNPGTPDGYAFGKAFPGKADSIWYYWDNYAAGEAAWKYKLREKGIATPIPACPDRAPYSPFPGARGARRLSKGLGCVTGPLLAGPNPFRVWSRSIGVKAVLHCRGGSRLLGQVTPGVRGTFSWDPRKSTRHW